MNRTRRRRRAAMRLVPVLGVGVVVVMASACGTPPASRSVRRTTAEGRSVAPQRDRGAARPRALSYLQEDYERIFPERLRLARYGEVRYAAGDQGDAGGDGDRSDKIEMSEAPSLVVVDQVRDRVRVIAPQDHYRLLLWIDVGDLYRVMTERVALVPDRPGAPAGPAPAGPAAEAGAAIRLRPGLAVEIDGEGRGMIHIKHRDQCVSFSGWVPRTAVGTQFVPVEATASQPSALVTAGTVVYERPGGREVARFMVDCEVLETGPESDGHRPISYTTEWFDLHGWVAAGAGKGSGVVGGSSSWGYGLGHLGLWGGRTRFRLEEGTCLYARRAGPAIGLVTEETDAPLSAAEGGWRQVPIETGWGDLTVWVVEESGRSSRPAPRERGPDHGQAAGGRDQGRIGDDEDEDSAGAATSPGAAQRPALRRCR